MLGAAQSGRRSQPAAAVAAARRGDHRGGAGGRHGHRRRPTRPGRATRACTRWWPRPSGTRSARPTSTRSDGPPCSAPRSGTPERAPQASGAGRARRRRGAVRPGAAAAATSSAACAVRGMWITPARSSLASSRAGAGVGGEALGVVVRVAGRRQQLDHPLDGAALLRGEVRQADAARRRRGPRARPARRARPRRRTPRRARAGGTCRSPGPAPRRTRRRSGRCSAP